MLLIFKDLEENCRKSQVKIQIRKHQFALNNSPVTIFPLICFPIKCIFNILVINFLGRVSILMLILSLVYALKKTPLYTCVKHCIKTHIV